MLLNPPAIIFVNKELTPQIQSVFIRQLYLTDLISDTEFDARVTADPNYPTIIHLNDERVMVLRDGYDMTNRDKADIVLFFKHGLVTVEFNRVGPHNIALPLDRVYLTTLITKTIAQPPPIQIHTHRVLDNNIVFPFGGLEIQADERRDEEIEGEGDL